MGNTIITLLSLLKVKQGFMSSMDQQLLIQVIQSSINVYGILNCS
jgi:hypothetical protein